ncbi:MAG: hypothetical protein IJP88_10080 [Synergistaceae bacterium]|nr:hypothetical protein [Synergistaceae bacterium]
MRTVVWSLLVIDNWKSLLPSVLVSFPLSEVKCVPVRSTFTRCSKVTSPSVPLNDADVTVLDPVLILSRTFTTIPLVSLLLVPAY